MFRLQCHFFNIWKWWNLMFLSLLNIPIRTTFLLSRWSGCCCCHTNCLLLFDWFLGLQLSKEGRILVLPVSNCPWNCNDSLNATIVHKATSSFDSFHFSWVIRLVIVTKLRNFACLINKNGPRVSRVSTKFVFLGNQAYASSASSTKGYRLDISQVRWF